MSGALAAKRFSRERFNRSLESLFSRLDARGAIELEVESRRGDTPHLRGRIRARVTRIWAVGSFARGAPECLDCDLVADADASWLEPPVVYGEHRPNWRRPPEWHLYGKQLLGTYPHVHVMSLARAETAMISDTAGGPLRPTFDIEKARLLYGDGVNWRKALASIQVDPSAGHHPRHYDALPLRLEQTAFTLEEAEKLLELYSAGVLAWTFETLHERLAPTSALLSAREREALADFAQFGASKKALEVAGAALLATRAVRERRSFWLESRLGGGLHQGAGVVYRFGNAYVGLTHFARRTPHAVVLVPHWTQTGPNRAWIVTRGPNFQQQAAQAASA